MNPPTTLSALRSLVAVRFPTALRKPAGGVPTGVAGLDAALGGGLPAGRLTELVSACPGSGGQLVQARVLFAARMARQRVALVDAADAFAPEALEPDVLRHLVWVRPGRLDEALAAADVLVRDGNYAVVIVDLRDINERLLRRVPATHWHRLHRVAEGRPGAVLVQTTFAQVPAVPWRLRLNVPQGLAARWRSQADLAACLKIETMRGHLALMEEKAG